MVNGTLYASPNNFRIFEALIAAKYGNATVKVEHILPANVDATKFFSGKLPCFETTDKKTFLTGSHAIATFLLGEKLCSPSHEMQQWASIVDNEIVPNLLAWVLPSVSATAYDKTHVEAAKTETLRFLSILNDFLLTRTFLVGERLTFADIAVACPLTLAFQYVLDPESRKKIVNVQRWFETCINQPNFCCVLGEKFEFCTKIAQFDQQKFKQFQESCPTTTDCQQKSIKPAAKEEKGKKEKKEKETKEKKKEEKPAVNGEDADDLDAADEALAQEPKQNDPFAAMPKGTFNLDEFKRVYSNEDTLTKAIPYFGQNFDSNAYSIWYCEYKYANELTLVFMSCNLISGMFQRLDKLRKNAFASMCLFGSDNKSTISGIWVWKGHELAFPLCDDWKIDYESYDWKKLDSTSEETKTMVKEYFAWEGDFGGKKFNQGKIFK